MYKIYKGEDMKEAERWLDECEKQNYKFLSLTNIANRGAFDIVIIMWKE